MLLKIADATKKFGTFCVLDGISLSIKAGAHLFVGDNGCGKSTLFKCIAGFIKLDGGQITIDGKTIVGLLPYQISRLGLIFNTQQPLLVDDLTVINHLQLTSSKLRSRNWDANCDVEVGRDRSLQEFRHDMEISVLKMASISEPLTEKLGNLSFGQKKAVQFACAIRSQARYLLLDEPFAGVDKNVRDLMLGYIREEKQNRTIMVCEHREKDNSKVFDEVYEMPLKNIVKIR